jgi:hypothetical protein
MPTRGDYTYAPQQKLFTRADGGETRRLRDIIPPPVEWGREYGDNGRTLREDARGLLAGGMTPQEVARELVALYGRQCECSAKDVAREAG